MNERCDRVWRLTRFSALGIAINLPLYFAFLLFLRVGLSPTLSAGICYGVGVLFSYLTNRKWTFASIASHRNDAPKFLLAYGVGLVSNLSTVTVLTMCLAPEVAQLFNIGLTALVNYYSLVFLRFGLNADKGLK